MSTRSLSLPLYRSAAFGDVSLTVTWITSASDGPGGVSLSPETPSVTRDLCSALVTATVPLRFDPGLRLAPLSSSPALERLICRSPAANELCGLDELVVYEACEKPITTTTTAAMTPHAKSRES